MWLKRRSHSLSFLKSVPIHQTAPRDVVTFNYRNCLDPPGPIKEEERNCLMFKYSPWPCQRRVWLILNKSSVKQAWKLRWQIWRVAFKLRAASSQAHFFLGIFLYLQDDIVGQSVRPIDWNESNSTEFMRGNGKINQNSPSFVGSSSSILN